jgi:hypothetical protein
MSLGALGYIGYGREATAGTAVAPTRFLPASSFSFEDSDDYMLPEQIRGSRDYSVAMAAPYNVSGSMDMELIPHDIGALLESAFCCTAAAASPYSGGGYQHDFIPGSEELTVTFESSAAGILVMRYSGIRVNTLEISGSFGEIVTASWGLEGTGRERQGSTSSATYAAVDPFHFSGASVKVDGTENGTVKEFTFGVNNNIERIGTLRKTRSWKRMASGMREVTLTLSLDFTDNAEYLRFEAGDTFEVVIHLEGGFISGSSGPKHTLVITIPNVRWTKVGVPLSAGDYLEQSVEATITKPAGGDIFTATLVNGEEDFA